MKSYRKDFILVCLVAALCLANGSKVEEELEKFMRGALDSMKTEAGLEGAEEEKNVYTTGDGEENTTRELQVEPIGNLTDTDNTTSNVAEGEPAFGEGIGSGFHGQLPRGQSQWVQRQDGFRGQRGQGIPDTRVQGQYPGFGSPEVHGDHIGGKDVRRPNIPHQVEPRVPDGRMGLPRPDGCLCNGPILNPCCFEKQKSIIRGQSDFLPRGQPPQGQLPQSHHHHHPDRQSGLQLPNGGGPSGQMVQPQTPIGLEYTGDFTCPVSHGNFPHPTDCSRFLQCAHNVAYDSPCPQGLLYDVTSGMCNWPDRVRCNTPTGTLYANQIYNSTVIIPSTWQVSWSNCRSLEVAVNAVFISVAQAIVGKPCPNSECQFPYIIVNCLK